MSASERAGPMLRAPGGTPGMLLRPRAAGAAAGVSLTPRDGGPVCPAGCAVRAPRAAATCRISGPSGSTSGASQNAYQRFWSTTAGVSSTPAPTSGSACCTLMRRMPLTTWYSGVRFCPTAAHGPPALRTASSRTVGVPLSIAKRARSSWLFSPFHATTSASCSTLAVSPDAALYWLMSHFTASASTTSVDPGTTNAAANGRIAAAPNNTTVLIRISRPPVTPSIACLLHREHPDHAAFGHVGIMAERDAVDARLHRARILPPSRHDADVLLAVDHERRRRRVDAGVGRLLPQHLARGRVEGAEQGIVGAAAEHEPAAGRQDRAPVRRILERVRPRLLARVDVPRLHFADVIGARRDIHLVERARPPPAVRRVEHARDHHGAEVLLRRHVDHARLRVERAGLPVLASVPRRAEAGELADRCAMIGIDLGPPGLRIEARENVLVDVRLAFDEPDLAARPLEEIEIAAAGEVDEAADRPAVAREIDQQRRRDLVEVPRLVRRVLEVALDRPGGRVDRDRRRRVEVVALALGRHPRIAVADAPVQQVGRRIVVAGDPRRAAAGLPLIARRPRVAAGFARRGNRVALPGLRAGRGIVGRHEAADRTVAARDPDDDLAVGDERRRRHVVALLVVLDCRSPDFFPRLRIDRDEHRFAQREEYLVAVERDAPVHRLRHARVRRARASIPPQLLTGLRVQRDHLVVGGRHEHDAVVDDRRRLMAVVHPRGQQPHWLQPLHVRGGDL